MSETLPLCRYMEPHPPHPMQIPVPYPDRSLTWCLGAGAYRLDGTWSCTRDNRTTPCGACDPCRDILASRQAGTELLGRDRA